MIPVFKYSNKLRENENYKKNVIALHVCSTFFIF